MTKWNSFVTPNRKQRYQVHIFILKISRLVNTGRIGLGVSDRNHAVSVVATEQDTVGPSWAQNPCPVSLSLVCIRTLVPYAFPKFQRANLIREVRKCRTKGKQTSKTKITV